MTDRNTTRALDAALQLFARQGFQRTSMAQVAETAHISRATLYAKFRDKSALFDGLALRLIAEALGAVEAAWRDDCSFAINLEAVILARDLPLHRLKHTSPYGGELLAANADAVAEHGEHLDSEFVALLLVRARSAETKDVSFVAFGGIERFGWFLSTAATGLKDTVRAEFAYREAVRVLAVISEAAVFLLKPSPIRASLTQTSPSPTNIPLRSPAPKTVRNRSK